MATMTRASRMGWICQRWRDHQPGLERAGWASSGLRAPGSGMRQAYPEDGTDTPACAGRKPALQASDPRRERLLEVVALEEVVEAVLVATAHLAAIDEGIDDDAEVGGGTEAPAMQDGEGERSVALAG